MKVKLILREMQEKVIGPTKIEQIFQVNMTFYVFYVSDVTARVKSAKNGLSKSSTSA